MLILRTKVRCEINDFDAICVLLSQPPGGLSFVLLFHALFRSNTHVLCIPLMCCYELVFKIISIPFLIISVILIRLFQFNSIVFPILLTQRSILSSSIVLTSRFVLKLTSVRFFLYTWLPCLVGLLCNIFKFLYILHPFKTPRLLHHGHTLSTKHHHDRW